MLIFPQLFLRDVCKFELPRIISSGVSSTEWKERKSYNGTIKKIVSWNIQNKNLAKKNTWEQAGVIASATSFSLSQSLISSSESNNLNDGISSPKKGVLLLKCVILDLNLFATFLTRLRAAKEWPGEHKGRKEQYSVHPSENHDKGF